MSAKEKKRIGGITLIVLQFVVGRVFAAEWETSNGKLHYSERFAVLGNNRSTNLRYDQQATTV